MPPVVYATSSHCCGVSNSLDKACSTSADGVGTGAIAAEAIGVMAGAASVDAGSVAPAADGADTAPSLGAAGSATAGAAH
ncbi:hypothetical protein D3C79_913060 [compost metagenome]